MRGGVYVAYEVTDEAKILFDGGLTLTLLSELSPKLRTFKEFLRKKYRSYLNTNSVPQEISDRMDIEKATAAITAWEGPGVPQDEQGQPLPCTKEHVERTMADLIWLRNDVLIAIGSKASFQKQELAELGKGSETPSGPS